MLVADCKVMACMWRASECMELHSTRGMRFAYRELDCLFYWKRGNRQPYSKAKLCLRLKECDGWHTHCPCMVDAVLSSHLQIFILQRHHEELLHISSNRMSKSQRSILSGARDPAQPSPYWPAHRNRVAARHTLAHQSIRIERCPTRTLIGLARRTKLRSSQGGPA